MTYLDYNATSPVRPEVIRAVADVMGHVGNPSSVHGPGREARRRVEAAREQVAQSVNASPRQVIFTSGGTEANNMALTRSGCDSCLTSAIEHDSVLDVARQAGDRAPLCPVDGNGVLDLGALKSLLEQTRGKTLVSVMLANNETGVIQPVARIAELAHQHGAIVHCDAVQALGKVPVDFRALGVDMMSVSAHKIGGVQGAGALVVRHELPLSPLIRGGGQELNRRAGTENVPGIVGFGVAASLAGTSVREMSRIKSLRDELEGRLIDEAPNVIVAGHDVDRLPNTICVAMPGVSAETQVMAMDLAGISVSSGSACSSGKVRASHVMTAMGYNDDIARSAIRVSFGWNSQDEDVNSFMAAWLALYNRTHKRTA